MSERITKNFTMEELTHSATAKRLKIDNTPNERERDNLITLAKEVLQPIRDAWRGAIIVSSGFRSKELNSLVGGSKTSQHCKGEAADITLGDKNKNKSLFGKIEKMIKNNEIEVGQLIDEYNFSWVHVSLPRPNAANNMILHLK